MRIVQILGTGCPKYNQLAAPTALGPELQLEMVSDRKQIMTFGAMMTSAMGPDGQWVSAGCFKQA